MRKWKKARGRINLRQLGKNQSQGNGADNGYQPAEYGNTANCRQVCRKHKNPGTHHIAGNHQGGRNQSDFIIFTCHVIHPIFVNAALYLCADRNFTIGEAQKFCRQKDLIILQITVYIK